MRYVILGAGAVGGAIGGLLHANGHESVLVARGAHLEALRGGGLRLVTPAGQETLAVPTAASTAEAGLEPDDILVVATKLQDAAAALNGVDPRLRRHLPVVSAQNGVEGERIAARRFARVYGVRVIVPATHLEPGTVEVHGSPLAGLLDIGCYPRGVDDTAARIAADLTDAGFLAAVTPTVMRLKYRKLIVNLRNAIEAIAGADASADLARRARREAEAVLAAAGIDVASTEEEAADRPRRERAFGALGFRSRNSTWQSLARGGGIETDYLNGEIVLLGRLHGVATPVNWAVAQLAAELAARGDAPGSTTVEELERRVAAVE